MPQKYFQFLLRSVISPKGVCEFTVEFMPTEIKEYETILYIEYDGIDESPEPLEVICKGNSVSMPNYSEVVKEGDFSFFTTIDFPFIIDTLEDGRKVARSTTDGQRGTSQLIVEFEIPQNNVGHLSWQGGAVITTEISLDRAMDYVDAVINTDINRVDGSIKNQERVLRLLKSYSRHLGTQTSLSMISSDLSSNENSFDVRTVQKYINALKLIFVIEDIPAWNPNLRSKAAIRKGDTRYFVDPSIAVASLGIGPNDLMMDLKTFGFIFENLCVRDLRVYAESLNGNVYHYRDSLGLECDTVIHLRNGQYGLVEIKLGGDKLIEEGAVNLLKLKDKIDTDKMNIPSFMMILTAVGKFAYQRKDGIYVVPITCLKE